MSGAPDRYRTFTEGVSTGTWTGVSPSRRRVMAGRGTKSKEDTGRLYFFLFYLSSFLFPFSFFSLLSSP